MTVTVVMASPSSQPTNRQGSGVKVGGSRSTCFAGAGGLDRSSDGGTILSPIWGQVCINTTCQRLSSFLSILFFFSIQYSQQLYRLPLDPFSSSTIQHNYNVEHDSNRDGDGDKDDRDNAHLADKRPASKPPKIHGIQDIPHLDAADCLTPLQKQDTIIIMDGIRLEMDFGLQIWASVCSLDSSILSSSSVANLAAVISNS